MSRRRILTGLAGTAAAGALFQAINSRRALGAASRSSLTFTEIPHIQDRTHHVAEGYTVNVLLRWGDPVTADAPAFDPMNQSAEDQAQQFGYNSDYVGFQPSPAGSENPNRGLLCVNHEYTIPHLIFPNVEPKQKLTKAQTEIEMAAPRARRRAGKTNEARNFKRYGLASRSHSNWADYLNRFNVDKEPNEPNRFGWIVEINPYQTDGARQVQARRRQRRG